MAKLTITQISIENLGPFRERQTFDLSVSEARPVILIKALNGSGKTTLLTALQVGLYGYKAVNLTRRSEYDQLIVGLQRKDAVGNARIEIALSVEVGANRQDMTLRREWLPSGANYREDFKVSIGNFVDHEFTENWDEYINGILPVELVQLFLFDGEKIEALANPERLPDLLRRATEVFLGLGGIDALSSDLKAVERRTGGKKSVSAELNEAQAQADAFKKQLDEVGSRIELLTQRHAHAQSEVEAAQRELEKFSTDAKRSGLSVYQQAAELKGRASIAVEQHKQARSGLVAALEDPLLPLAWLGPLWEQYKVQWQDDRQAHNAALLADEFAKRDRRILEALSAAAPQASQAVASLLEQDLLGFSTQLSHTPVLQPGAEPDDIEPRLEQAKAQLKRAVAKVEDAAYGLDKAERAVGQIPADEQLAGVLEQMKAHTKAVSAAEALLHGLTNELAEARTSQAHASSRMEAALQKVKAEMKDNAFELQMLEAAARARTTLVVFREKLLASKALWLSEMITSEFKQLLRKRNLISRVLVEPQTYEVSIEDVNGHMLPMERLSAGERQILAIAVLSALIRERKGRFPVVVDTPLARLDRSHREALIHNFFAKVSHQVLVLSTDEEVEGSVHTALEQHMSREYALTFDDASRRSIASVHAHQLQLEAAL
nr:DNA sulfur modification protein DndD [uncultured Pseudomonas sp.]